MSNALCEEFGQLDEERTYQGLVTALVFHRREHPDRKVVLLQNALADALRRGLRLTDNSTHAEEAAYRIVRAQGVPQGQGNLPPAAERLLACVWRLCRSGLADPLMCSLTNSHDSSPFALQLTERGIRTFDAGGGDHPRRPGFVARLHTRCPTLDAEVINRLDDAVACLDAGLARPAVVMAGLAVEHEVGRLHDQLVSRGLTPQLRPRAPAADVLAAVTVYAGTLAQGSERRRRLQTAVCAADVIRDSRNAAAHEIASGILDEDAEAHVRSAANVIPTLWEEVGRL